MLSSIDDARTTPPWARVPVLVGLGLFAAWFLVCYRFALASLGVAQEPAGLAPYGDLFWLGRWRMFTDLRPIHTDLEVYALTNGGEAWVDMPALYPSHWTEGPGYLRDDVLDNPDRLAVIGEDICQRLPTHPRAIRFTKVTWPKSVGQVDQPRTNATKTDLTTYPCGSVRRR